MFNFGNNSMVYSPVAFEKWSAAWPCFRPPPRIRSVSFLRLSSESYPFVSEETLAGSRRHRRRRLPFAASRSSPPWPLLSSLKRLGSPPLSSLRSPPFPRLRYISSSFGLMNGKLDGFCFQFWRFFCWFWLQFKIALCQLSVTADKSRNIAHARRAIEEAASKGARLVLLPVSYPLLF